MVYSASPSGWTTVTHIGLIAFFITQLFFVQSILLTRKFIHPSIHLSICPFPHLYTDIGHHHGNVKSKLGLHCYAVWSKDSVPLPNCHSIILSPCQVLPRQCGPP